MRNQPAHARSGQPPLPALEPLLTRGTRVRRTAAFGGMLALVGGLVAVRAAVTPAPKSALAASGLVRSARTQPVTPSPGPSAPKTSRTPAKPGAPAARRQFVGQPFDVGYGTVQVRVTVVGRRLVDVTPLSLPQGGRSSEISAGAAPQLRREALAAQSARIDTVSGASYTSAGYARSLQSALDRAFAAG